MRNYVASGLKGIRVAVGMYNRRNEFEAVIRQSGNRRDYLPDVRRPQL